MIFLGRNNLDKENVKADNVNDIERQEKQKDIDIKYNQEEGKKMISSYI
jgi:hypothetical protein